MNYRYLRYKGMRVNTFGLPIFHNSVHDRIKKKNRKKAFYLSSFSSPFDNNTPKSLMIMYDIPHNLKIERDWLRRHLKKFYYTMVQKSVWIGPSPLPKNFLKYLDEIKIGDNFKTFKLAKSYKTKSKEM